MAVLAAQTPSGHGRTRVGRGVRPCCHVVGGGGRSGGGNARTERVGHSAHGAVSYAPCAPGPGTATAQQRRRHHRAFASVPLPHHHACNGPSARTKTEPTRAIKLPQGAVPCRSACVCRAGVHRPARSGAGVHNGAEPGRRSVVAVPRWIVQWMEHNHGRGDRAAAGPNAQPQRVMYASTCAHESDDA